MANWTQKKLMLTIGGAGLAVALAAVGGVYYAQGLIDEIVAQEAQKNEAIAAADKKLAQVPGLEKEVIILRENLDEYVKILPDTRQLNNFVRMLSNCERQSGVVASRLALNGRSSSGKSTGAFTPIEYTYEMTATLWQCLKFMNLIENYERFVSITQFDIHTGGGQKGEETRDGDVVHEVTLTLQTYSYNGKQDGKEVTIPDYESKKEDLHEEIWKRLQAIRLDRYDHKGKQSRRDILTDPRERGDIKSDGPSPAEQRALLEQYVGEIAKLRDMHDRMRQKETTLFEQVALEKALKEGVERLLTELEDRAGRITYTPYKTRWSKEIVAPFDELRGQLSDAAKAEPRKADPFLPKPELQQLVAEMETDCNNGQLEQAKTRYEAVASRLGVGPQDPRHELAVAAKAWHVKACTALDFKALDLRMQGVVVNPEGRSAVLLNNEAYEEGDYISDDLLVKLVEEEQVWFVYRGLTLVRTM